MWNHYPDPESQPILIPSHLYSIGWLLGLAKWFHIMLLNYGTIALPQFDSTLRFHTCVFSFADSLPYGIINNVLRTAPSQNKFEAGLSSTVHSIFTGFRAKSIYIYIREMRTISSQLTRIMIDRLYLWSNYICLVSPGFGQYHFIFILWHIKLHG